MSEQPLQRRRRAIAILVLVPLAGLASLIAIYRPDRAVRVGTASVSQVLCEEVFIAGLDPRRVFAEEVAPRAGLRPLLKHLRYDIDRRRQQVETTWAGHFGSASRYRQDRGCLAKDLQAARPADEGDSAARCR